MNGISIIVPAYRASNFIKETLDSIKTQTAFKNDANYEIIVGVDGCKETLETLELIQDLYTNLRILNMPINRGTYVAINTILSECKYDKCIIFGADDIMLPTLVEFNLDALKTYDIVRNKFEIFVTDSDYVPYSNTGVAAGAISFNCSILKKLGGFRDWTCSADSELLVRAGNANIKILESPKVNFNYRIHQNSLTNAGETRNGSDVRIRNNAEIEMVRRMPLTYIKPIINTFIEI